MRASDLQVGDKIRLIGYPDPLRITDKIALKRRTDVFPHSITIGRGYYLRLNNYLSLYVRPEAEIEVVGR